MITIQRSVVYMKKIIKQRKTFLRITIFLLTLLCVAVITANQTFAEVVVQREISYPQRANLFLRSPISRQEAEKLAKYDVIVLHMLSQQNSSANIRYIREINPDIIILVYVASEEFPITEYKNWDRNPNGALRQQLQGITPDMWLLNEQGRHVKFWRENWMLNITDYPTKERIRWNEYLANFVVDHHLSTGLWDGIFYDNVWTGISWIENGKIDIDRDGENDSKEKIDRLWKEGMKKLFSLSRQKARERLGKDIIIIGNGDRGYYDDINGLYMENFTADYKETWPERMELYKAVARKGVEPRFAIVGNTTLDTGKRYDYRNVRFGLTSALLEDGLYAFDYGSSSHTELWWYDEYDSNLGKPIDTSVSKNGHETYVHDIWKREFEKGISVVNSTHEEKKVDLGGEYEKIHGKQDPEVNDGAIVSKLNIDSFDGLLLLKTNATIANVLYTNGAFTRFFREDGTRVRNGYFAFDETFEGGDQVADIEISGDGKVDSFVATGNTIEAWRHDGQRLFKKYPYGAAYTGDMRIALGDITGNGEKEVIVAPGPGNSQPIKIYTRDGIIVEDDWYPFGAGYTGGYSVAVARDAAIALGSVVVGSGKGVSPRVVVYSHDLKKQHEWAPYEYAFRGGVNVAAGDTDGDGVDEIVTGPGVGGKTWVRVYAFDGTLKRTWLAYNAFGYPGVDVRVVDVDFDGVEDVVTLSEGI